MDKSRCVSNKYSWKSVKCVSKKLVDDKSVADQKINGIMKIYSSNGTLIHSTSFPDAFTAKKKGGVEELKTTIRDPTLGQVITKVTFTDLKKTETFSNSTRIVC